jgi:hypothetical protein
MIMRLLQDEVLMSEHLHTPIGPRAERGLSPATGR